MLKTHQQVVVVRQEIERVSRPVSDSDDGLDNADAGYRAGYAAALAGEPGVFPRNLRASSVYEGSWNTGWFDCSSRAMDMYRRHLVQCGSEVEMSKPGPA